MTLFRVVVNSTYADLQWFRFLVKKWRKLSSFKESISWTYRKNNFREKTAKKFPLLFFDTAQTQCLCGVRDFIVVL